MFLFVWFGSARESRLQARREPLVPRGTRRKGGGLGGKGGGGGGPIVVLPGADEQELLDETERDENEWPDLDEVLDPGEEDAEIIDETDDSDVELIEEDDTIDGEVEPAGEIGWEGSSE